MCCSLTVFNCSPRLARVWSCSQSLGQSVVQQSCTQLFCFCCILLTNCLSAALSYDYSLKPCFPSCHVISKVMHTCRTDSDASHHSFSFTARARPPDSDGQRGSTLSPRGSQGGIPLSPRISQPSSAREGHSSAKPRPDSSFAVKVWDFYQCSSILYTHMTNL